MEDLKRRYRAGGLGDVAIKRHLVEVLEDLLAPIRVRRTEFAKNPEQVLRILQEGTERGRAVTYRTLSEVRQAMRLQFYSHG